MCVCACVYSLGTPDTSLRGLNTLKARRAFTSNPAALPPIEVPPSPLVACSNIALKSLNERMKDEVIDSLSFYIPDLKIF